MTKSAALCPSRASSTSTSAADACTSCRRGSGKESCKNWTKSGLTSSATSLASARIRRRISFVKVPTPGPYSTSTRARFQSTCRSTWATTKEELGSIHPTKLGYFKKFRAKRAVCPNREHDFSRILSVPDSRLRLQPAGQSCAPEQADCLFLVVPDQVFGFKTKWKKLKK